MRSRDSSRTHCETLEGLTSARGAGGSRASYTLPTSGCRNGAVPHSFVTAAAPSAALLQPWRGAAASGPAGREEPGALAVVRAISIANDHGISDPACCMNHQVSRPTHATVQDTAAHSRVTLSQLSDSQAAGGRRRRASLYAVCISLDSFP